MKEELNNNKNNIVQFKCLGCGSDMLIDCSKIPTDIKTFDTRCPRCGAFRKYNNLNYIESTSNLNNNIFSLKYFNNQTGEKILADDTLIKIENIPDVGFQNEISDINVINNIKKLIEERSKRLAEISTNSSTNNLSVASSKDMNQEIRIQLNNNRYQLLLYRLNEEDGAFFKRLLAKIYAELDIYTIIKKEELGFKYAIPSNWIKSKDESGFTFIKNIGTQLDKYMTSDEHLVFNDFVILNCGNKDNDVKKYADILETFINANPKNFTLKMNSTKHPNDNFEIYDLQFMLTVQKFNYLMSFCKILDNVILFIFPIGVENNLDINIANKILESLRLITQ